MSKEKAEIVVIDYGMGNIRSIQNALIRVGADVTISNRAKNLYNADALVLPGVGAFGEAISNLESLKLIDPIINAVKKDGKPLLGICLGMQLLADSSEEGSLSKGLSLIPGLVERIPVGATLRLPHIGWNSLSIRHKEPLFSGIFEGDSFYFVHSYHFVCDPSDIAATTDYGCEVVAAVQRGNVFGVQFHPERSHNKGLLLLRNFIDYVNQTCKEAALC